MFTKSTVPDLRDVRLHAVASNIDLSYADLRGAVIDQAKLSGAILAFANLSGAFIIEGDFGQANMTGAKLCSAVVGFANFSGVNLTNADLSGAAIIGGRIGSSSTRRYTIEDLTGVGGYSLITPDKARGDFQSDRAPKFVGADLTMANLRGAVIVGDFTGANLTRARMDAATVFGGYVENGSVRLAARGGGRRAEPAIWPGGRRMCRRPRPL